MALGLALAGCSFDPTRAPPPPQLAQELSELQGKLSANPEDLDTRVRLVEAHVRAGHLFAAADLAKETTDRWPREPRAYAALAATYDRLGYFMKGFETLRKCLEAVPENEPCTVTMAFMLMGEGSDFARKEARRMLRKLVERATPSTPRLAEAKATLEVLEKELGPDTGAPPEVAASQPGMPPTPANPHGTPTSPVDMIPGHGTAGPEGADVGELNDFGRAFARALEATRNQDVKGAEAAFRDALKIKGDDASALAGLAETLLVQGMTKEAVQHAKRAYELAPGEPQTRWTFGLVMTKSGVDVAAGVDAWRALARDTPEVAAQVGVPQFIEQFDRAKTPQK